MTTIMVVVAMHGDSNSDTDNNDDYEGDDPEYPDT